MTARMGLAALAIAASLASSACDEDNLFVRNCRLLSYNNGEQYELDYYLEIPRDCPIPLGSDYETKRAAARIFDYGTSDFVFGLVEIKNSDGILVQDALTLFASEPYPLPGGGTGYRMEALASTEYPAATGSAINNQHDYGFFVATNTASPGAEPEDPYGRVRISYVQSFIATRVAGTSIPPSNALVTWAAEASGGYPPYTFDWYRDGVWVGSGAYYTANAGTRDFILRLETTDATMSVHRAIMGVDVDGVAVAMSGPTRIWVSEGGGTWTASAQGGTPPYTYQWSIEGSAVHTGQTFTGFRQGRDGQFTLRVDAADAAGARASATALVDQVGTGSGTCDPPPGADECM